MATAGPAHAAGFLLFRKTNLPECLLLKASYGEFHWSPPKGYVDDNESIFTAALRETTEETGILSHQIRLHKNFKEDLKYIVNERPKVVTFWLGEVSPDIKIRLSKEHTEFGWFKIEEALNLVKYRNMAELLVKGYKFLLKAPVSDDE